MRKTQDHLKLRTRRRQGYVLIFFAMLVFGLMAMAALVIDLGFARLTQRQMQTASDAAALEGLRGEGSVAYNDRLESARNLAAWNFDDDLDLAADNGAFDSGTGQFGAEPLVSFSGGAGDAALAASQLMEVDPNNPVYKPEILSGVQTSDGFQVAMKRGGAAETETDLYSHGPAVPYLFGRGSLMHRDLIQQGIVVRGTAVSEGRRVLSIGMADNSISPALMGLLPFALELDYWNDLTTGVPDNQFINAGMIGTGGQCYILGSLELMPVVIGRPLPPSNNLADDTYVGYVPIYAPITNGNISTNRVVGFGQVTAVVSTNNMDMTQSIEINRQVSAIVSENASAVPCHSLSTLNLSSAELAEVFNRSATIQETLLAPVLVR